MKATAVIGFMATAPRNTPFKDSLLRTQPASARTLIKITAALAAFGSLAIEDGTGVCPAIFSMRTGVSIFSQSLRGDFIIRTLKPPAAFPLGIFDM
ncbi:MAG: hypothetical protein HZB84_06225 [Deltaproteobacteria bacterium]|nr:hypothetical protein [Deltaproteobacteria bacterium]